jgi:WD40 repeat protein
VAGYGIQSTRGNIDIYRDPGAAGKVNGDLVAHLETGIEGDADHDGHWNSVNALAFDPTGRFLASASLDSTVRIWDWQHQRTLAILRSHGNNSVEALAFTPDGSRLITGGRDGSVALWDVAPQALDALGREMDGLVDPVARRQRSERASREMFRTRVEPTPKARTAVTSICTSPDGRWVIIGRDDGPLIRFNATDLGGVVELPRFQERTHVKAMAISPDGSRLAVSLMHLEKAPPADRLHCRYEIEFRSLPDGRPIGQGPAQGNGMVKALAFGPGGRSLAYSGGDDPVILIRDLAVPGSAPSRLAGRGRPIWEVGFTPDGRQVAFSWSRADEPGAPDTYVGFDLRLRTLSDVDRRRLLVARHEWAGMTARPINETRIQVNDGRGGAQDINLAIEQVGNWWTYSFIPPSPGHIGTALAVGTDLGVVLVFAIDPATGAYRQTRSFSGHAGAVYSLAPSADGAWLATASADQTVKLWPLAGCTSIPPFGATFVRGVAGPIVSAVEPASFARRMGLEPGDEVTGLYLPPEKLDLAFVAKLDGLGPDSYIQFQVRRNGQVIELGTTKRDNPALSLFVGNDREWVFWSPYGYYDSSVVGDRTFLGWHRNGSKVGKAEVDFAIPTDYVAAHQYEKELRRPDVIDSMIATADVERALKLVHPAILDAPRLVGEDFPPRVTLEAKGPAMPGRRVITSPELAIVAKVVAAETGDGAERLVGSIHFLIDGNLQLQPQVPPGKPSWNASAKLVIPPGVHKISVHADNDKGRERIDGLVVEYRPGPDVPKPVRQTRNVAICFGADSFPESGKLTSIQFADRDSRDLARFFEDASGRGGQHPDRPTVLAGSEATSDRLGRAIEVLDSARERGDLGLGDAAFVFIEGHFLRQGRGGRILGADATGGFPFGPSLDAGKVADVLGRLAASGCRVMVLIDGEHTFIAPRETWDARTNEWARDLIKRNVIVFVASTQGPSRRPQTIGHGIFAQAVLDSQNLGNRPRLDREPGRPMTLGEFRDVVENSVKRLSGPEPQFARCFFPEDGLDPATYLFGPPVPSVAEVRGAGPAAVR